MSLAALIDHVRERDLGAFAHSDVPFEALVEVLNPERSQGRHPLFQVALVFQNAGGSVLKLGDLTVTGLDTDSSAAKFDLQLTLIEQFDEIGQPAGIASEFTYATDLFDHETVQTIARRFLRVIDAITEESASVVGNLEVLSADERDQLLNRSGGSAAAIVLLPDLLARTVELSPHAVAIRFEGKSTTYSELDVFSSQLARVLICRGVGPEKSNRRWQYRDRQNRFLPCGLSPRRCCLLPVDPKYPADRVKFMLVDSVQLGLTTDEIIDTLPAEVDWLTIDSGLVSNTRDLTPTIVDADRVRPLRSANTAYMILYLGFDRSAQGRLGDAQRIGQLRCLNRKLATSWTSARARCIWRRRASTHRFSNCFWPLPLVEHGDRTRLDLRWVRTCSVGRRGTGFAPRHHPRRVGVHGPSDPRRSGCGHCRRRGLPSRVGGELGPRSTILQRVQTTETTIMTNISSPFVSDRR